MIQINKVFLEQLEERETLYCTKDTPEQEQKIISDLKKNLLLINEKEYSYLPNYGNKLEASDFTLRDIVLMHLILHSEFEASKSSMGYNLHYYKKNLNIEAKEYQFLVDAIIDFSKREKKIVKVMDEGKAYQSFEAIFETEKFIKKGDFFWFYGQKEKSISDFESIKPNIIAENVIYNQSNGDMSIGDLKQTSPKPKESKNILLSAIAG